MTRNPRIAPAVGRTKQAAGRAARNPRLYMDGVGQARRGRMQKIIGRLKGMFGRRI